MRILIDDSRPEHYGMYLSIKRLPIYCFRGCVAEFSDEYAGRVFRDSRQDDRGTTDRQFIADLFDYQRDIVAIALRKRKYAIFADCGLGKTLMLLEYIRNVAMELPEQRSILIVSPLMVIKQTLAECRRFYGDTLRIERITADRLTDWMRTGDPRIGITNYEALRTDTPPGNLGCLVLDESSMLKSHYGKWGTTCLRLGRGLDWKLCCTGTPAPNDRIEYANHAVFLEAFPNVNAFLARFFVNRGQTANRWELKRHALEPFYRALSHWSIFLVNPGRYGWHDNTTPLPPIHVHLHDVELTAEQIGVAYSQTGELFANRIGGITSRSVLSQVAKGNHRGNAIKTRKPAYIRSLIENWRHDEQTLIWCLYNAEQTRLEQEFPGELSIRGDTSFDVRENAIEAFKSGEARVLISKPKMLGFGLNLHMATRQVFSGIQDSYESFYQAVKRSNRYGATRPLNVHIPLTDIERPMVDTVLRKARMIADDTEQQERIFRNVFVSN